MKIGIITIQKCNNFGAELQAYALQRKLQLMGYEAENIDYLFYKHPEHRKTKRSKPILKLSIVNRIKEFLLPILRPSKPNRKFDAFVETNIRLSRKYVSIDELYNEPPKYDLYMVGSDQVWNPRMGSNILPYFLDFAPAGARCVSYGSSMGVHEIPAQAFYRYKQQLKKFSAIGVREKSGADIVRAMGLTAEVKHVVDPTMLLSAEEWAEVARAPVGRYEEPYVLLYDLIPSEETVALARRWADARGVRVVRMGDGDYGPSEFVWLFAHAEAVVTNSYHGTVFSVLNGKDFYSVIPKGLTSFGRMESLVKLIGAEARMVRAGDIRSVDFEKQIDWKLVNEMLKVAVDDSTDFLRREVEGRVKTVSPKLPIGCYAVWNADDKARSESTSGGAFRVLAEQVILRGGIVYGAAFAKDFRHVEHVSAETIEELEPILKSKYVWSDPTAAYKGAITALKAGREVLFSGTPCQIAAIKALAKGLEAKLSTVDLVCHGTPLPKYWAAYVEELEKILGGRLTRYEFRNKDSGWNFPRIVAETGKRKYDVIPYLDPYFAGYGKNVILREACFRCPFVGLERISDFTVSDCWRVASSNAAWDDNKGTSLVLANTDKSVCTIEELLAGGELRGGIYDFDLAQLRNMPLQQRAQKSGFYVRFAESFESSGSFGEASKLYMTKKFRVRSILVYWVKKFGWFYFKHRQ